MKFKETPMTPSTPLQGKGSRRRASNVFVVSERGTAGGDSNAKKKKRATGSTMLVAVSPSLNLTPDRDASVLSTPEGAAAATPVASKKKTQKSAKTVLMEDLEAGSTAKVESKRQKSSEKNLQVQQSIDKEESGASLTKTQKQKKKKEKKNKKDIEEAALEAEDDVEEELETTNKRGAKGSKQTVKLLIDQDDELDDMLGAADDDDFEDEGGEDSDDVDHSNLIESMATLDGKKKRVTVNRGDNDMTDETNLPVSDRVDLNDLLQPLDKDARKLRTRLQGESHTAMSVPLEGPAADRVTREAGYSRVRQEIGVWDAVVHSRRTAETLEFPLNKPDLKLETTSQAVESRFKDKTPLEDQIAALLAGSKSVAKPGEDLSEIEKKALAGLTRRELAERKAELAKFRALQSYQQAKHARQSKIKSKKFRKIARKEKKKEEQKRLEMLALSNPVAAAEELEEAEKKRIEERASLKHRNASRFFQELAKRVKITKDKDMQAVLTEQLAKHRELIAKQRQESDSEEDEDDVMADLLDPDKLAAEFGAEGKSEGYTEFAAKYRQFYAEQQAKKQQEAKEAEENEDEDEAPAKPDIEDLFEGAEQAAREKVARALSGKRKANHEDQEEAEEEDEEDGLEHAESLQFPSKSQQKDLPSAAKRAKKDKPVDVNPDDFMKKTVKHIKSSSMPEIIGYNEEDEDSGVDDADESDGDAEQRKNIAEAFAEDDVMADFEKEKAELVAASKPKAVDLTLPGWGEWGGGGLMPSKRKRKRFMVKAPPPEKRRDDNRGDLILNVDKDDKIRGHKVSNIPFQYSSVSDFEASIRAPLGDTFLPRTAFLKMIKPKVKSRAGDIIKPMDKTQLVKRGLIQLEGIEERKS